MGQRANVQLYLSPATARPYGRTALDGQAGVGIWVKNKFIQRVCGAGGIDESIDVFPGRAAIWRGGGQHGQIQIGVVYLHTRNSGGRTEKREVLRC